MDTNEIILNEIRELRTELRDYARVTTQNENDIRWLKGSAKIGATLVAAAVSAIISITAKWFIK